MPSQPLSEDWFLIRTGPRFVQQLLDQEYEDHRRDNQMVLNLSIHVLAWSYGLAMNQVISQSVEAIGPDTCLGADFSPFLISYFSIGTDTVGRSYHL